MTTTESPFVVAWDTETRLIGPAQYAPPLVCTSIKHEKGEHLLHHTESEPFFDSILTDPDCVFVGHNLAFDLGVVAAKWPRFLPLIFKAIEEGRAKCTMLRMKLIDIATGCYRGEYLPPTEKELKAGKKQGKWFAITYDLSLTFWRFTKRRLQKDKWRLRYREFENIPIEQWPRGAREYPIMDAVATYAIYVGQENVRKFVADEIADNFPDIDKPDPLGDETNQMKYAWWIHLMSCWGIRTNTEKLTKLKKETEKEYQETRDFLQSTPICSECGRIIVSPEPGTRPQCLKHPEAMYVALVRPSGQRNTKAAQLRMKYVMGGRANCRLTKSAATADKIEDKHISLDKEACELANDKLLKEYEALSSLQTVVNKDIPALRKGRFLPIHSRFNTLIATGRTSSSAPNIQNIRRLPGIRECFVPRKGNVFLNADYDGLELRTLAQVCVSLFGKSHLADILNGGKDPHLMVAATILKISYEEAERRNEAQDEEVDRARQTGKVANFGFPGGLGYESLILFAKRAYKINMSLEEAMELKENWLLSFPEMEKYFAYIGAMTAKSFDNVATIQQLFTKRIRGKIKFTVACNSYFQGLGSDATKAAGWLISKACYIEPDSPLYGCRIVNYVHDEFILECPEERSHEAAMELKRLMELGASPFLPDVAPTVSKPIVARCWSKKAQQVWKIGKPGNKHKPANDNDRLVPWDETRCECGACEKARKEKEAKKKKAA